LAEKRIVDWDELYKKYYEKDTNIGD